MTKRGARHVILATRRSRTSRCGIRVRTVFKAFNAGTTEIFTSVVATRSLSPEDMQRARHAAVPSYTAFLTGQETAIVELRQTSALIQTAAVQLIWHGMARTAVAGMVDHRS